MDITMKSVKRLVAKLSNNLQIELKRLRYRRQIKSGRFTADEPEVALITSLLKRGDWVIDVGANIGQYTCQFAQCVGESGRVLAFEPIGETFELLASNLRAAGARNVSLFNVAASSRVSLARMSVPKFADTGLDNPYRASLTDGGEYPILCVAIDMLPIPAPIRLAKIDAEGHDVEVLKGMAATIDRYHPFIIVEDSHDGEAWQWLEARGYHVSKNPGSPNLVAYWGAKNPAGGSYQSTTSK